MGNERCKICAKPARYSEFSPDIGTNYFCTKKCRDISAKNKLYRASPMYDLKKEICMMNWWCTPKIETEKHTGKVEEVSSYGVCVDFGEKPIDLWFNTKFKKKLEIGDKIKITIEKIR